jgi:glycosyltransferase involved in cell wall biosynthesis
VTDRVLILQTLGRADLFSPNNALLTLARHLDRGRYQMTVAVPHEGAFPEALRKEGVPVFRVPGLRTYRRHDAPWRLPLVALRAARLASAGQVRLIVANHAELAPFACAAARLNRVPWVCMLRQADRPPRYYRKYRVARADAVGAVSEAALSAYRRYLKTEGIEEGRMRSIPTGIDLPGEGSGPDKGTVRSASGWDASDPVIGTVGLREVKRPEMLIRILGRLAGRQPRARCLFVGEVEQDARLRLESLAESLGLEEWIHFAGRQRDMGSFYGAMDVYAHTSSSEAMPKTVLEAMAHRLPVVAFRVGGLPEAVADGETGFLCEPDDGEAFADRLARVIADPGLATRLGAAGRRRLEERFSPQAMADGMMSLFDSARQSAGRTRRGC